MDAEALFAKYDKDGDGTISKEELQTILSEHGLASSPEDAAKIVAQVDKDGDGEIDKTEFQAVVKMLQK